jgi:hypothetical protein
VIVSALMITSFVGGYNVGRGVRPASVPAGVQPL